MKKYIKDGVIITEGTTVTGNGKVYYNPSAEIYAALGWEEYVEPAPVKTVEQARQEKIDAIIQYDDSDNVNDFIVNGEHAWIAKADRVGLMNSTTILKANGAANASLWLNTTEYVIPCDTLISMLQSLELYALNCYYVTEQHISEVSALNSVEDIEAYDITEDYPQKLTFTIA